MMSRKSGMSGNFANRNRRVRLRFVPVLLMIACVISACGGSASTYEEIAEIAPAAAAEEYGYDDAAYDSGAALNSAGRAADYKMMDEAVAAEGAGSETDYVQNQSGQDMAAVPETSRKLIKTVNIRAESEDFDALVPALQKQVEDLGGYIESISVYDVNSYYVD